MIFVADVELQSFRKNGEADKDGSFVELGLEVGDFYACRHYRLAQSSNLESKDCKLHVQMKSDIEKTIDPRVAAAFDDILPDPGGRARSEVLKGVCDLVRTVWIGKIYNALPKDKTTIAEYFLDAELERFLNEAIEECYSVIVSIAERAKDQFSR